MTTAPHFEDYSAAQAWIADRAKAYGGKRKFCASDEYRAMYPAILSAYEADRHAVRDRYKEAGYKHGQRVEVIVGHSIFGPIYRDAILDLVGTVAKAKLVKLFRAPDRSSAIRTITNPRIMIN